MAWTPRVSQAIGWPARIETASRMHPRLTARASARRALAGRLALGVGATLLILVWLACVGMIAYEMIGWWAEFGVRALKPGVESLPPGW